MFLFRYAPAWVMIPFIAFPSLANGEGIGFLDPPGFQAANDGRGFAETREAVYRDMAATGNTIYLTGRGAALAGAGFFWAGLFMSPGREPLVDMKMREVSLLGMMTMWGGIAAMGIGARRVQEADMHLHDKVKAGRTESASRSLYAAWPLYLAGLTAQVTGFAVLSMLSDGDVATPESVGERIAFTALLGGHTLQYASVYLFSRRRHAGMNSLSAFRVSPEIRMADRKPDGAALKFAFTF